MTYLEFLILFIGIPLFAISFWAYKKQCLDQKNITGIGLMCVIALVYTTPWDNYLIMENIWSYPAGVVLATIGYVPIEEYGFMVMQTMLAGILWSLVSCKINVFRTHSLSEGNSSQFDPGFVGSYCLSHESGTYAGLIWFGPFHLWPCSGDWVRGLF